MVTILKSCTPKEAKIHLTSYSASRRMTSKVLWRKSISTFSHRQQLAEIQQATAQDVTMQCLAYLIRTQSWRNMDKLPQKFQDADLTELNHFKQVRHELTVNGPTNIIILRDRRIIVPAALRDKAISIAHEGHQGLKTKQLLRERIWFQESMTLSRR